MIVILIIFAATFLFFLGWMIGYPIYRKVIGKPVFVGSNYALGVCIAALILNLCNLFIQVMKLL